jgi:DNA polymerase I-like protein with 3'-5' exonuclease and polymerase domains
MKTRSIKPRRTKLDPSQMPLITPESSWVVPGELPDLSRVQDVAIDSEELDNGIIRGAGPGWAFNSRSAGGYIAGVSAAWRQGGEVRSIYVPIEHPDTNCFDRSRAKKWVQHLLRAKKGQRRIFCNAGYDLGWFNAGEYSGGLGLELPDYEFINDIGCQAMMIDENRRAKKGQKSAYSLDSIAEWCGVERKDEAMLRDAAFSFGYKGDDVKKYLAKMPARYVGPYAEQDARSTLLAFEKMVPQIEEQDLTGAYDLEMELIPVVHAMRKRGVRVNEERLDWLENELMKQYQFALNKIYDITKQRVSIDEIRQKSWLIQACQVHGVDEEEYMRGEDEDGEVETEFSKDWMRASEHPLPRAIAEAKQCHEAATKFVRAYLKNSVYEGRIHANINQFKTEDGGTRSHRFSYSEPPLQQMPSRPDPVEGWHTTEMIAKYLRMAFLPERGQLWFAPDYSQQEYRLIVHYAALLGCKKADEAVAKYLSDPNTDFHNLVVEMTGLTRRRAKDVNFAKAYGAGVKKFAAMTGMTLDEAEQVMGQYDGEMPFVKQLNALCQGYAEDRGYIRMIDKARSHFDDFEPKWLDREEKRRGYAYKFAMNSCRLEEALERCETKGHPWFGKKLRRADTRKAMNRLIQGSAARQTKKAMAMCARAGFIPMLQMHDELAFSLTREKDGQAIGEIMRNAIRISVPMRVDEEYGETWGTAKYPFSDARKPGKGRAPELLAA